MKKLDVILLMDWLDLEKEKTELEIRHKDEL